jgi:hypothetical protein
VCLDTWSRESTQPSESGARHEFGKDSIAPVSLWTNRCNQGYVQASEKVRNFVTNRFSIALALPQPPVLVNPQPAKPG